MRIPLDDWLVSERFRRSSKYRPEWVIASASGGANALWLTELRAEALDLRIECITTEQEAVATWPLRQTPLSDLTTWLSGTKRPGRYRFLFCSCAVYR